MKLKNYLRLFFIVFCLGCDNKPVDRNAFKDEMENREIMRVTAGQLSNYAFKKGKLALDSIDKSYNVRLDSAISKSEANAFCTLENLPFVVWLKNEMKIEVNRLTKEEITDTTSKIYQVFDAYTFNVENMISCVDNLQKVEDKTLILTRAIVLKEQKCVTCHSVKNRSSAKTSIFGRSKGDLMGIWTFEMPKKELIKKITLKDLKNLKD